MSEAKSKSKMNDNLFQLSLAFNFYAVVQLLGNTLSAYPTARMGATFVFGLILFCVGVVGLDNWAKIYHAKGGIYGNLQHFVGFLPAIVLSGLAVIALLTGIHIDTSASSNKQTYHNQNYHQLENENEGVSDVFYK